jgi:hypothetical protein
MRHSELEIELREKLRTFPLYEDSQEVLVHSRDEKITYSYTADRRRLPMPSDQTYFDFDIEKDVCFIFGFRIQRDLTRQGYGTRLNNIIEDFAKDKGCSTMRANPSGDSSKLFRKKLGYKDTKSIEVEKQL